MKTLIIFDFFFLSGDDLYSYCGKGVLILSVPYSFGCLIIQAGYNMVSFQRLFINGSQRLFSKRKCIYSFNQCLQKDNWKVFPLRSLYTMAYTWLPHKFHKIFDTALNFIFPQFSHPLTIHTFQTLVWTQCVCWPGLHSIFHSERKVRYKERNMSLPNPFLARRKWFPEWRITDWKPTREIQKWREGVYRDSCLYRPPIVGVSAWHQFIILL